jgi:hypothetical protein
LTLTRKLKRNQKRIRDKHRLLSLGLDRSSKRSRRLELNQLKRRAMMLKAKCSN